MTHKLLLVDDDQQLLDGLRRALHKEAFEILCATSAEEALGILRAHSVDVVVSDQNMPGMSGTVFLATVRQQHPDTVRFILTGKATLDVALEAINEGAVSRFFTKPSNAVDLAKAIRRELEYKDLLTAAHRLLEKTKRQSSILKQLEKRQPGITQVQRDQDGAVILDGKPIDYETLMQEVNEQLNLER